MDPEGRLGDVAGVRPPGRGHEPAPRRLQQDPQAAAAAHCGGSHHGGVQAAQGKLYSASE